jgi:hypothetical protein
MTRGSAAEVADRGVVGWVRHYDLRVDDAPVGTVLEVEQASGFLAVARFTLDAEVVESRFRVALDDGRPVRSQRGNAPWREVPTGAIPSSLYRNALRSVGSVWSSFDEGSGEVRERRFDPREGWLVEVDVATGDAHRRFRVEDDEVVAIDWGGGQATSHLLDVEPIRCPSPGGSRPSVAVGSW